VREVFEFEFLTDHSTAPSSFLAAG
jgi:hypothetical protein